MSAKTTNLLNEDHLSTISNAIREICIDNNTFCDCTLYVSNGISVNAHRAILSACSPYLKNIIENHPLSEPEIYLPDVSKAEIVAIVEFIYTGEATIPLDDLPRFFETCKELQIAHLKEYEIKNELAEKVEEDFHLLEVFDLPTLDIESQCELINEDFIEDLSASAVVSEGEVNAESDDDLKDEPLENVSQPTKKKKQRELVFTNEDRGFIIDYGPAFVKRYQCKKCGKRYSHRRTLLHHIHWICDQPATYACTQCSYKGKRKFQLRSHVEHVHLYKRRGRSLLKPNFIYSNLNSA